MRKIMGSVMLCAAVAATGCAGVSNALRVDRRTPAEVELDAAVAATTDLAEYHGSNVRLAKIFTGVATKDARAFEAAGLPKTAETIRSCPSEDLSLRTTAWPTPLALVVQIEEWCTTKAGAAFSDGVYVSGSESSLTFAEYQFPEDPDGGRSAGEISDRYTGLQYVIMPGLPMGVAVPDAMSRVITTAVLSVVYADERTVEITRSPEHPHDYSVRIQQTADFHLLRGDYDRGLADIGRLADAYGGHPDGVVTPWELGKFEQDLPTLAAVVDRKLTDADVLAAERKSGVRVDEAMQWISAVSGAAPNWGRVVRDRGDSFGREF